MWTLLVHECRNVDGKWRMNVAMQAEMAREHRAGGEARAQEGFQGRTLALGKTYLVWRWRAVPDS